MLVVLLIKPFSQMTNCGRKFDFGFLLLIHLETTKSRSKLNTQGRQHGFFGARSLLIGKGMVASFGFMENVCISREFPRSCAYHFPLPSGLWEERPSVRNTLVVCLMVTYMVPQLRNH